jgi:hypothetical protein
MMCSPGLTSRRWSRDPIREPKWRAGCPATAEVPQKTDEIVASPKTSGSGPSIVGSALHQIHVGSVTLSLDFFRDHLTADHLATLLIECESRLPIELPTVVERLGHS